MQTSDTTSTQRLLAQTRRRDAAVQNFFERFAAALTAGDADGIVDLWSIPALLVSDSMQAPLASVEDVRQLFAGAKQHYNERGISEAKPDVRGIHWATERMVVVDVHWPYFDRSHHVIGGEASTYVLRKNEGGELKICVAAMHGEQRKKAD